MYISAWIIDLIFLYLTGRTFSLTMEFNNHNNHSDVNLCEIDYNELVKAQKDAATLIVDVREDHEIADTGKLPGSIHIPSKYIVGFKPKVYYSDLIIIF